MIGLCDRFHCLPSQLDEEDGEIMKLVAIYNAGTRREQPQWPEST